MTRPARGCIVAVMEARMTDYPVTDATIAAAKAAQLQGRIDLVMADERIVIDKDGNPDSIEYLDRSDRRWRRQAECPLCSMPGDLLTRHGVGSLNAYRCTDEDCGDIYAAVEPDPTPWIATAW